MDIWDNLGAKGWGWFSMPMGLILFGVRALITTLGVIMYRSLARPLLTLSP